MKALSLLQPWASLVAIGAKLYETRTWRTPHRGEIAIHASRTMGKDARRLLTEEPFLEVLVSAGLLISRGLSRRKPRMIPARRNSTSRVRYR